MTDSELLERAAAAAGIEHAGWWDTMGALALRDPVGGSWNPLTDDGDALRLAVRLQISINADGAEPWCTVGDEEEDDRVWGPERTDMDPCAATRRAIVRAAAAMKEKR